MISQEEIKIVVMDEYLISHGMNKQLYLVEAIDTLSKSVRIKIIWKGLLQMHIIPQTNLTLYNG